LQILLVLKTINLKLTMPRVLYIKWSTNFLYLICKGKKTMVKIIKFIQIFIVFLSLIVLITSDSKFSSKPISNYLLYTVLYITIHLFLVIFLYSYLILQISCFAIMTRIVLQIYAALLLMLGSVVYFCVIASQSARKKTFK
jgi:hypothetical protein